MYIVREKDTENYYIFKEKTQLSQFIEASVDTIRRREGKSMWEWKNYTVIIPKKTKIKSNRGGDMGYNPVLRVKG